MFVVHAFITPASADQSIDPKGLIIVGGYHSSSFKPNTDLYVIPSHTLVSHRECVDDSMRSKEVEGWERVNTTGHKPSHGFGGNQVGGQLNVHGDSVSNDSM